MNPSDDPLSPETLGTMLDNETRETLELQLKKANARLLIDDPYRKQVCLHEAGHIFYGYRMGMNSYEILLPEIFTSSDGRLFVSGASVLPLENAVCKPGENFDLCYARHLAAGGVVADKLSILSYWEGVCAAGDFHMFVDFMTKKGKQDQIKTNWELAVDDIRNELRASQTSSSGLLVSQIESMAEEVSVKLLTRAGAFTENKGGRNMIRVTLRNGKPAILTETDGNPLILFKFCNYDSTVLVDGDSLFLTENNPDWDDIKRIRNWNSKVKEANIARRAGRLRF